MRVIGSARREGDAAMRLTRYSDYCLRVLIYAGVRGGSLATIKEISEAYGISGNHLMKVVYELSRMGYLETIRGKKGGIRLAVPAEDINLGRLVRQTEQDLALVECFAPEGRCVIAPACVLKSALGEALGAFLGVLDRYTLADLLEPRRHLAGRLAIAEAPGAGR